MASCFEACESAARSKRQHAILTLTNSTGASLVHLGITTYAVVVPRSDVTILKWQIGGKRSLQGVSMLGVCDHMMRLRWPRREAGGHE